MSVRRHKVQRPQRLLDAFVTMWQVVLPDSRHYLFPNQTYTFGRSAKGARDRFFALPSSSISRNHLAISVKKGRGTEPSLLEIVDLGSKFGSKINSKPLNGMATLTSDAKLELGTLEIPLVWTPCNICYSTGETGEAHNVMWDHAKSVLAPLDIRLFAEINESTTKFMRGSKTTSLLMHALALGIPILSTRFVDAVGDSRLRDGVWPDETKFLQNKEWAVNPRRRTCLSGQRFYFNDEPQFNNMKSAIEAAGGSVSLNTNDGLLIQPRSAGAVAGASSFVTLDELLQAVIEARHAVPMAASKRRRPQRAAFLGHMTQFEPAVTQGNSTPSSAGTAGTAVASPAAPSPQPSSPAAISQTSTVASLPARKRPQRHEMLNHLVGTSSLTQTQPQKHAAPSVIAASPPHKMAKPDHKRAEPERDQEQAHEQDTAEEPEPKRSRLENDDLSLDSLECLAIVECSLELKPRSRPASGPAKDYSDRPNFKAFRKKGLPKPVKHPPLVLGVWGGTPTAAAEAAAPPAEQEEEELFCAPVDVAAAPEEEDDEFSFRFS